MWRLNNECKKYIYSPATYFELSKLDYLHPFKQKQQSEMDDDLALGGLYEIISTVDNLCILSPGNFKVKKTDLVPYNKDKYSFRLGDYVIFNPRCSTEEIKYVILLNRFIIGRRYKINKIINYYYVLLENEKGETSNPIKFSDIEH